MPRVSVILTSFNHAEYLQEAINSVLDQTFSDFELIIWDDASEDESWSIISAYKDPRIKAFRNDCSRRGVYGVNQAIEHIAQGAYVAIHHSDDVWLPDKLSKQVAALDSHPDWGAVFTWAVIIDDHGMEQPNPWFSLPQMTRWEWLRLLFIGENHLNHPSVLIRRECFRQVGLYRYGLAQTGDAEMWSRLLLAYDIHVIEEALTKHRIFLSDRNTSGSKGPRLVRTENEWNILRLNFFHSVACEDLFRIFPGLDKYRRPTGCIQEFVLSMACLTECQSRSAWHLGLSTLYGLVATAESGRAVHELYGFDYRDLVALSGQCDTFGLEARRTAEEQPPGGALRRLLERLSARGR